MDNRYKSVLVTGASKGIGKCCAVRLAEHNFRVFAGVRSEKSSAEFAGLANEHLIPIEIDITRPESIAEAIRQLDSEGIFALVNNAGSAVLGPSEFIPIDEFRRQFEVNFFGHIALTQALLPQLRANRGRIVYMSSISGFIGFPFFGPYCSSKFALEGFSDSLRRELKGNGVDVSLIQPGNTMTDIWKTSFAIGKSLEDRFPKVAYDIYGRRFNRSTANRFGPSYQMSPENVAHAVFRALTDRKPKERYLVGKEAVKYSLLKRFLGNRFIDRVL